MKKSIALILCCALIFVTADVTRTSTQNSGDVSTTVKSTKVLPETTTTLSTTTSTTQNPNITTEAPTTSATQPKTTTFPSTTSTQTPTTPAPGPPKVGKWNVTGTDSIIMAQMAIQLDVIYNVSNQQNSSKATIDIPNNAQASGTFSQNNETMKLAWKSAGVGENFVVVSFRQDSKSKTYTLSSIEVSIEQEDLPGANSTLKLVHKQEHFNTTLGNSYRCVRLQTFNLTRENDTQVVGQMKVSDLQFQAFKTDKKSGFGLAEDCAFDTPDVVPIAVGCVLAGLVVIVLVAYLFSRRRSQARGYLSM